jgi:hypothetical protein
MWLRHPSSTSQVLGSIPRGNAFLDWVRKNLFVSPHVKAQVKALSSYGYSAWRRLGTHMRQCDLCVRVGEEFGDFLSLDEKIFLIECAPPTLAHTQIEIFFTSKNITNMRNHSISAKIGTAKKIKGRTMGDL